MRLEKRGLSSPLRLGPDRGLLTLDLNSSIQTMLERCLMTHRGERVNRPDFGVGIMTTVFEGNSLFLATRVRLALKDHLRQYLEEQIELLSLNLEHEEETLHVFLEYQVRAVQNSKGKLDLLIPIVGGTP